MNLCELERRYLSCLVNGGKPCDITLHNSNFERVHAEVKRLKNNGFVQIPISVIEGSDFLDDYDERPVQAEYYASEILEEQKKREIKAAAEGVDNCIPSEEQIYDLKAKLDKIAEKTGRMEIISAEDLRNKQFGNTEFIVEKLIPVGLTILMGAPKQGKSWFLLLLADAISSGTSILNYRSKKAPVLYFTLEDSVKRCKYRLGKLKDRSIPWNRNFYLTEKAKGNSGIVRGIEQTNARAVIIDTFGAFATDIKDGNDYHETTRVIRQLKEIAENYQVAIIVVHHTRKNKKENTGDWTSEIMGSQGWVGAADTLIGIERAYSGGEITNNGHFRIKGRDIPDAYVPIKLDNGYWQVDYDRFEQIKNKRAKNG